MLADLRKTFRFFDADLRRRWLLLVPLAVAATALEALGAVLMLEFIRLVVEPRTGEEGRVLAAVRGLIAGRADDDTFVLRFSLLLGAFYLAKNVLRYGEVHARQSCASRSVDSLSTRLLEAYLRAPYAFHLRRNSAELIRNANASIAVICRTVLYSVTAMISEALVVTTILVILVLSVPAVALVATAAVSVVMVTLLWATQRRYGAWGKRAHVLGANLLQELHQSLDGVKEVKLLGRIEAAVQLFGSARRDLSAIERKRGTLAVAPRLVVETLFIAGLVALVITARATGMVQDQLASVLGFFVYVGFRVLPSIHLIVFHLNHMEFGRASIDEVHGDWTRLMGSEVKTERPEPMPFRDRLEVDGVSFVYAAPEDGSEESPARDPSLRDVDLEVRRGESVGIAGSTGAGKSTLVDLLLGLLEPTGGEIRVDGVPIRGRVEAWQRQVGYVPQGVHLIDDTLTRNIALGLRDEEVDAERVAEVARMAQLDELLERLPEGLATVVGERGVRLSGGERQRVAVARALYRDPEVLVLDEATAALDNRTERELTRAIETLRGRKTLIVVAHRLSTVERCDRVVFLRDGRVADTGPFDELLERCADFRAMAGRG